MKTKITLSIVLIFVFVLRLATISFGDIYNDSALYSFRSLGWFDWLGKASQSTPFDWLTTIPFWVKLSFHDAPPLAFLLQNISFNLFGDSVLVARLPFVISGVGSVFLVYFLLKKIADPLTASVATVLYSFISYGVWAGQAANLEGIEEIFIVGSIFLGGFYLFKSQKIIYIYGWSAIMACALLVKYTAIFLLPPVVVSMFLYKSVLHKHWKHFILSIILFITIISPVLIYNSKVYELRGHFDRALSLMLGVQSNDFGLANDQITNFDIKQNYKDVFLTLAKNISYPLLLLTVICLIILFWKLRSIGFKSFEWWILLNTLSLLSLFIVSRASDRFLSIIIPFIVIIVALGIKHGISGIRSNIYRYSFIFLVGLVFIFELAYSINTNLLNNPIGLSGWMYSENKIQNLGFNQLNDFIRKDIIVDLPERNSAKTRDELDLTNSDVQGRSVIIYDDRINWFAQMWYIQKYPLYYRWPVISTSYLYPANEETIDLKALLSISGKPAYFIYPISPIVTDPIRDTESNSSYISLSIAEQLEKSSVPVTIIRNRSNTAVFKVYKINNYNIIMKGI